ncbi:MAG TPA: AAA family ATPase, partial [Nitrospiraceae bacterium]|nr:AAA family ATPase [Nitrospiraceae bacterium]
CEVDVDIFRHDSIALGASAVTLDTLARAAYAAGLYKGDLLEDWDLEWCHLEREQLRQRFVHTLRALAEGFERLRRYDLALQYARRAVDADPTDELAQRALIRLLSSTGDKTSAVSQFRRFADYARSELGVEPDSQTMALFRQIKETSSEYPQHDSAETGVLPMRPWIPLVGRTAERQQIAALLNAAMAGNGGSVLIVGEAGIGKSRLAEWVTEEWAARGGLTTRGRCIEFNDPIPYQPILDSIGTVADITGITGFANKDSGGFLPPFEDAAVSTASEQKRSDATWPAGKLRLFGWLLARMDKVSRRRPLLTVIEDLQWADASSVDFLAYLLERARSMRLLVLVTARPAGGAVGHVTRIERLTRYCARTLRLHPLTPVETAELVRLLLDRPRLDSEVARHIYAETEGNPLFVVETIRLLQQQGRVPESKALLLKVLDDPVKLSPSSRIPDGVRDAVEQRLQLIDPAALRIACIASVLGRSFDEELLSMIAGAGANRLSQAIGRLLRAEIFEREDAGYRFAHDKIRAVCYESLPVRMRRNYHARAAAALSQLPGLPIHRLAWQQHSAGQWNLAAASWDQAGDDAVAIHAYGEALTAYRYAIVCTQRDREATTEAAVNNEIRLLFKCDKALAGLGRPLDRRRVLDTIDVLCKAAPDATLRANLLVRTALLEDHVGNSSLAARLARKAWSIACVVRDQHMEIEALHLVA